MQVAKLRQHTFVVRRYRCGWQYLAYSHSAVTSYWWDWDIDKYTICSTLEDARERAEDYKQWKKAKKNALKPERIYPIKEKS